jgi:hypothetical protein
MIKVRTASVEVLVLKGFPEYMYIHIYMNMDVCICMSVVLINKLMYI